MTNSDQIKGIAQQVYDQNMTSDQFAVGQVAFHTHNDIDSPALTYQSLTYGGRIDDPGDFLATVTGAFSGGETSATLTSAWHFPSGAYTTEFSNGDIYDVTYTAGSTAISWGRTVTATSGFAGGETSATLTAPWPDLSGSISTKFSNGDIRSVGYTVSSTSVSWVGALSGVATATLHAYVLGSAATANLVILGVGATAAFLPRGWKFAQAGDGVYTITHNLGTTLYSAIAVPIHSLGNVVTPDTYQFANEVTFTWIDITNPPSTIGTSFAFTLTAIANKSPGYPQYVLN